jgi:hypothetical protein
MMFVERDIISPYIFYQNISFARTGLNPGEDKAWVGETGQSL